MASIDLQGLINEVLEMVKKRKGGQNDIFGLTSKQERDKEDLQKSDERRYKSEGEYWKDIRNRNTLLEHQKIADDNAYEKERMVQNATTGREHEKNVDVFNIDKYKTQMTTPSIEEKAGANMYAAVIKAGGSTDQAMEAYRAAFNMPNSTRPTGNSGIINGVNATPPATSPDKTPPISNVPPRDPNSTIGSDFNRYVAPLANAAGAGIIGGTRDILNYFGSDRLPRIGSNGRSGGGAQRTSNA